jgi:uncharacterized protein DUF29
MSEVTTAYETDVVAWSREQAEALRAEASRSSNNRLDWANLAEEIESVGTSQRHELKSQIRRIIEHLLKLQHSPAINPRRGWIETIIDARAEVELVLDDSPSLKREIAAALPLALKHGSRKALAGLEDHGELDKNTLDRFAGTTYTVEQIIGDWFPPEPQQ